MGELRSGSKLPSRGCWSKGSRPQVPDPAILVTGVERGVKKLDGLHAKTAQKTHACRVENVEGFHIAVWNDGTARVSHYEADT